MKFLDAHTHLQLPTYDADRDAMVARARAAGGRRVNVGTQAASSVETVSGILQAKLSGVTRRAACEPSSPTVTARSPTAKPRTSAPTSAKVR